MAVQTSNRKWLFIVGGVIVAAGVVVFLRNYPPPKDVTGTIGAAQRYHSTQITGDDVKVDETEVTRWVQSETFDRIVKDPAARKLFVTQSVQQLLVNDSMRQRALGTQQIDSARPNGVVVDSARPNGVVVDSARPNGVVVDSARPNGVVVDSARPNGVVVDSARPNGVVVDSARPNGVVVDSARPNGIQIDSLKLNADQLAAASNAAIRDALRNENFCQALANSNLRQALVNYAQKLDSGGSVE